ncbi:aminoglycoside phosphotransferase [Streptomyces sp. H27-G5]|uniref:aminoglycoside phosphotransferase n=1 Tax=Streptomyces sp. H27-G5 TaxID=2996698 RepID=UPI00226E45E3|nr:aminoglycoside phosphotransferase [Streptomyces sp. H27-G5]MCY0923643.1 aminoglycoside phosphotransferase [Streptomyces sp. H27-G5]
MTTNRLKVIPPDALALIAGRTGTILKYENAGGGLNSEIAAHVHTADGSVFVKGLRLDHRRLWTQRREAEMAPYLDGIAPALVWRLKGAGWDLNAFEDIDGRHADYSPGSPDLPLLVDLLTRLSQVSAPDLELRCMPDRMQHHAENAYLFQGDALLHTDWFPTNVLVDVAHGVRVVDWAWAATGAAWIDTALWVVWLINSGHTPAEAEGWGVKVPAFRDAPDIAVDAFAEATVSVWAEITENDPEAWALKMLEAARAWVSSRSTS